MRGGRWRLRATHAPADLAPDHLVDARIVRELGELPHQLLYLLRGERGLERLHAPPFRDRGERNLALGSAARWSRADAVLPPMGLIVTEMLPSALPYPAARDAGHRPGVVTKLTARGSRAYRRGWVRTSDLSRVRRSTSGCIQEVCRRKPPHDAQPSPSGHHEFQGIPWDLGQRPTSLAQKAAFRATREPPPYSGRSPCGHGPPNHDRRVSQAWEATLCAKGSGERRNHAKGAAGRAAAWHAQTRRSGSLERHCCRASAALVRAALRGDACFDGGAIATLRGLYFDGARSRRRVGVVAGLLLLGVGGIRGRCWWR